MPDYKMRFGTQTNDEKAREQNKHFVTMCGAAAITRSHGGSKAFTPKDLELFAASEEQQRITFRGYDKITWNPPAHGTLSAWTITPEMRAKLERGF